MKKKNASPSTEETISRSRRNMLKSAGLLGAAVAGSKAAGQSLPERQDAAASASIPVREALENLSALEADTLEAATERILPSDGNGPGAREARAAHYIDRSLAAHHAESHELYVTGLNILHEYALKSYGTGFAQLPAEWQDSILTRMENGDIEGFPGAAGFFSTLRSHTIEGSFSDPYYGGNRDYIGWDLLGYPGVRLSTTAEEVAQGRALSPSRQSAYDQAIFSKSRGGRQ